ncbi:uncharacterized protein CDAR_185641 [Caerostris darwini]|uniref:Uncharacterized protein n=1 Tax=Caerostris darwini TaxID=1538125 RepID=A0AAV4TAL7_9ARAC|nr:uncharacterized protein CDAR_185641 [Caerostris darwini]
MPKNLPNTDKCVKQVFETMRKDVPELVESKHKDVPELVELKHKDVYELVESKHMPVMAGDEDLPSLDDWEDFWVPPPPPPPSLGSVCRDSDFYCRLEGGPMGAHYNRASFPSLPIIAVCSSVVLVAVLVASFLLWR